MEYNYIHDFQKSQWADYGDHGLYLDEQTSGYTVSHNVLVNCPAISTNHPGTDTMTDNAGTLASTISAAGIEPAYIDIKDNLTIPTPTFASSGGLDGGAATGACTNTGGASGAGGVPAVGGSLGAGGARNAGGGGAISVGGVIGAGGVVGAGGAIGTSGTTNAGGGIGTGGATNTGGAAMRTGGSIVFGGAVASGGAMATGGLTGTGGTSVTADSMNAGGASNPNGTATSSGTQPGAAASGCGCRVGGKGWGSKTDLDRQCCLLLGLMALGLHRLLRDRQSPPREGV
jgi:hypothetical protein